MSVLSFSFTQQLYYGRHTMEEFKKLKWTEDLVMSKTPVTVGWMDNGIYNSKIFNLTPLMAMVLSTNVWQNYYYYTVDLPSINIKGNVLRKGSTFPNVIKENKNLILKVINTQPLLFGIFDGIEQIHSFIPKTLTKPFFAGPFKTNPYQMSDQNAYEKIFYFLFSSNAIEISKYALNDSVKENNVERTVLYWAVRNVRDEMSYRIFKLILSYCNIKIMLTKTFDKFVVQWFDSTNKWEQIAEERYMEKLYTKYNLNKLVFLYQYIQKEDREFFREKIKIYEEQKKIKQNKKEEEKSTKNPFFGKTLPKPKLKF